MEVVERGGPVMARTVNPRGRGAELRQEILRAAEALLAETTSAQAVTLRGIARRAGIAAPSIYPHFADRDAILDAVVTAAFADLAAQMAAAAPPGAPARDRLAALCGAYVDFARGAPGRYRVLFERSAGNLSADRRSYPEGLRSFELLTAAVAGCVAEGTSTSTDPIVTSAVLWAALHGLVSLPPATPGFPWPPLDQLLRQLVEGVTLA